MAGGMTSGPGLTLEQRSRLSGIGERRPSRTRRRHCWVTGPTGQPGPWPGLVLDWQQTEGGWRAWVVYLLGDEDVVVQGWVERSRLAPAEGADIGG
jgi:hypothetical protein